MENLAAHGPLPSHIIYLWCDQVRVNARICSSFLLTTRARIASERSEPRPAGVVVTRHLN